MALVIKDRVKETTTTTGTGTFNLAGAVSGFEGFIQVGDGNTTYYVCTDNTDFEIGIGTFTDASPDTLSRDTILQSSNSDNKVNWSAGTRTIFCTYPADKAVFEDASNNINGTFVGNITGDVTGNADTATTLETARTINGTSFNGSADITVTAAAGTLTGSTLNSGVTASSLTSLGTLASNLNLGGQDIVTTTSNQDIDLAAHGTGKVVIKGNTNQGAIKLNCEANSHGQTIIAAPHSESANNTLTLPSTGGDARLVTTSSTATLTNKTFDVEGTGNSISNIDVADFKSGVLDTDISSVSGSDDTLASAKAIKTYVDAQKADMQFVLEDGDGTEVQITKDSEVKFVEGGGLDINWTDTSTGSDGDPYDLTFTVNAAQTGISSVVNTSLEIGRDADNRIKFGTDNQIIFEVSGGDNVIFKASGEIEASSLDISGDADIDGTLEADAITVGGTALNTVIAGVTVTNATTAAVATTVTISDNESTNEDNAIIFTSGGDVDGGNIGLESDGDLTYNPSTGRLTATQLSGTLQTAAQSNITSLGTLTGLTVDGDATLTGANYNVVWDKSDNALEFTDNAKLKIGTGGDLEVYHSSNNSVIADSSSGSLFIRGSVIRIDDPNSDDYIVCTQDGSVDVYHNGSKKFETTSAGATVTGVVTADGFTIGSAVIAEAELEQLDGITAGTVAASKAVVVDANKDVASFRNVTLTGELDAATGDFSGDVDVDGTLEADAITVNGTALNTVIADEATALAIALG